MTIDVREAPHIREAPEKATPREFDAAEISALAHLYRGEIYRSTAWRTRLDNTTNWAVVTTGIALTVTFSHPEASPLPLVIVGLLLTVFLLFEARRYRYFSVWRARARLLETDFYAPMLLLEGVRIDSGWNRLLAQDYREPRQYISLLRAIGRRLRRNYAWILAIQALAYYGKVSIHPTPITGLDDLWQRAAIGPIPGELVVLAGLLFHGGWLVFALITLWLDLAERRRRRTRIAMG
jgi:uncharacterized membrane protein